MGESSRASRSAAVAHGSAARCHLCRAWAVRVLGPASSTREDRSCQGLVVLVPRLWGLFAVLRSVCYRGLRGYLPVADLLLPVADLLLPVADLSLPVADLLLPVADLLHYP